MAGYVLGADIGGTTIRIGLFDGEKLVQSIKLPTKSSDPIQAFKDIAQFAKKKGIGIEKAGIAVAGPIMRGKVKMVNAIHSLSHKDLQKAIGIKNVLLINDFEAAAYGANTLQKGDAIARNRAKPKEKGVKAVIGAGTGLGKALLVYDEKSKAYLAIPSEEGHSHLPINDEEEFALLNFLKSRNKRDIVYWEDVLSGNGIVSLYEFASQDAPSPLKDTISKSKDLAAAISLGRNSDPACRKAFELFARFYARFAKTTVLSCLPFGGLYIAGGIAMKNPDILSSAEFRREWENAGVMKGMVKSIPLLRIKNEDLGLRGAALKARLHKFIN